MTNSEALSIFEDIKEECFNNGCSLNTAIECIAQDYNIESTLLKTEYIKYNIALKAFNSSFQFSI